jgi:hypothetical protein
LINSIADLLQLDGGRLTLFAAKNCIDEEVIRSPVSCRKIDGQENDNLENSKENSKQRKNIINETRLKWNERMPERLALAIG